LVKVWTNTRTGGSVELSVLLAVGSIVVMIGKDMLVLRRAVSVTRLLNVTKKREWL
jgi:hypothetical protein